MSGKRSRTKGHSFEREVAIALRKVFPDAKRHLESQWQEALGGYDLDHTGRFRIQCKRFKKYANPSMLEEVKAPGTPVLVTKADHKKAIACLYLKDFINLLQEIQK